MDVPKQIYWTETKLTETEKQATGNIILVECLDIVAGRGMDMGTQTKLTPKDDKFVDSQNLPTPIHRNEDLIVKLVSLYTYGIITVLAFPKYASPIFCTEESKRKNRYSCGSQENYFSNCK